MNAQVADTEVSASYVNAMIRVWKRERLACYAAALGYPRTNVLHPEHGIGTGTSLAAAQRISDAERVQAIVNTMPADVRACFEALHIGVVRGHSIREWPHKPRWLCLGISQKTYFRRTKEGWQMVREGLRKQWNRTAQA